MYQLCATGARDPLSNEDGELRRMCVFLRALSVFDNTRRF